MPCQTYWRILPRWYIYKPPSDVIPFFELGHNFSFITPDSFGRWEVSEKYITSNSMLQHTLAPIFRPTYADYLAVAIYDKRKGDRNFAGSVTRGVLMADELGGVWIYHTVPGLVNLKNAVNAVLHSLRNIYPKPTYLRIPEKVQPLLPEWNLFKMPIIGAKPKTKNFVTRGSSLHVEFLARRPGDKESLYQKFAISKNIVLDVYGQSKSKYLTSICGKKYSVRNIDNISLKLPEKVIYLMNRTDRMWFAVSTAAHWQNLGSGPKQYWACISNLDKEDNSGAGGDLVCVENYRIWHTFDNFKVEEPNCIQ
ncbi:jg18163 [Pararge aegeria aegeria]|uniref:Jg18163 protein n=1 Tax=Pararge aegeria aegeria TaxID=348720 RepID=A0A8S4SGK7_9NEOP|nr:jg18163 [Pararge aegeria aegeria]